METLKQQQSRLINNSVPLNSNDLLTMTVKGERYYVRPVKGFSGYFVATCGSVISCVSGFNGRRNRITRDQPKLLKPSDNGNGYLFVKLYSGNGHCKRMYVHRLVASALLRRLQFSEGIKYQVNHINQDRGDNRACNLEWTTAEGNMHWNAVVKRAQEERDAL